MATGSVATFETERPRLVDLGRVLAPLGGRRRRLASTRSEDRPGGLHDLDADLDEVAESARCPTTHHKEH